MATKRTEFLFWTKVPDANDELVSVKVYVDIDHAIEIARRAARNKGRKAKLGPISCEALKGQYDPIAGVPQR